jgi:hypothetical protein
MKRLTGMVVLSFGCLVLAGCGTSPDGSAQANSNADRGPAATGSASAETTVPPASAQPGEVVAGFYDALKAGSEAGITALLTDKAREETAKSGLDIRPQASSTLSYAIGETQIVDERGSGAHVKTQWTETDSDGTAATTEVIWVLRKQANGWRIAGMATRVAEGQLPLLFNFEDPEDMLRKREYVEKELSGGEQPVVQQADRAVDPATGAPVLR